MSVSLCAWSVGATEDEHDIANTLSTAATCNVDLSQPLSNGNSIGAYTAVHRRQRSNGGWASKWTCKG